MKKLFLSMTCGTLLGTMSLFAENPMNFREYTQEFSLEFESPEAAKAAVLSLRPLPDKYVMALSARWDDTNFQHALTRDLMIKHGLKGTFYMTGLANGGCIDLAAKLVKDGFSLGVHTIGHPFIITRNPHSQFRQYMKNRIEEEVASQTAVNTCVQPFGGVSYGPMPEMGFSVGRSLMATGIIGTPDFYTNNTGFEASIGYPKGVLAQSRVLTAGDAMPDLEKFDRLLAEYLADTATLARHPSISMGVHSCHTAGEGQARLDKELERLSGHEDWWYCNQSEYSAYRYEFFNDKFDVVQDGAVLKVNVTRMEPGELGAEPPLWFSVENSIPIAVSGAELKEKLVSLPHAHASLPIVYDVVDNEGKAPRFTDISLMFKEENGAWIAEMKNSSGEKLENIWVTFRFSGKVEETVVRRNAGVLEQGQSTVWTVPVQKTPDGPFFNGGIPLGIAQVDFTQNGIRCRLFATADGTQIQTPVTAAQVVRFFKVALDAEPDLAALSVVGAPLDFPEYGYSDDGLSAPGFIQTPFGDGKPAKLIQIVEFVPKQAGSAKLFLDAAGEHSEFWLNGKVVGKDKAVYDVDLLEGRNRLAVVVRYITFNVLSFDLPVKQDGVVDFVKF